MAPASSSSPQPAPDSLINQEDARRYWESVSADINGMLGGIPLVEGLSQISSIELRGSRAFLAKLGVGSRAGRQKVSQVLEGGAGIGRVTKGLLLNVADQIDIIEPMERFTAVLQDGREEIRHIWNVGLEDWQPMEEIRYDLIWIQWCVGHLNDAQLVAFLQRCKSVLNPEGGFIVLKENVTTSGKDLFNEEDSAVTRSDNKFQNLFKEAGLHVLRMQFQRGLPKTDLALFPIRMYALK